MSSTDNAGQSDDAPQSVHERLDDIESRLTGVEMDLKQTASLAKDALATADDALDATEETAAEIRDDLRELENELQDIADRTDLLRHVKQASALSSEEKAAVCLQTLVAEAQRSNDKATMTAPEAKKALGGDVDRTLMYKVLPKAAELVGDDDVLEWVKEDRSSPKNSRLKLDLTSGDLPGSVAGFDITGGEPV